MANAHPKVTGRIDDPHMAQKEAIDKLLPVESNLEEKEDGEQTGLDLIPAPEAGEPELAALPPLPSLALPTANAEMARVLAELTQKLDAQAHEIDALKQAKLIDGGPIDNTGEQLGPVGYPWQYYKQPVRTLPDGSIGLSAGWISAGPGGALSTGERDAGAYTRYQMKGMKPITEYGSCPVPSVAPKTPGGVFVAMLEKGGAKEFPVTQILAYKWHVNPPIKGLTFPQIEAVREQVRHFICSDCAFDLWFLAEDQEARATSLRHLRAPGKDGRHNHPYRDAIAYLKYQGIEPPGPQWEMPAEDVVGGTLGVPDRNAPLTVGATIG